MHADATTEMSSITRELEIHARPETVWELLTDPEEAVRWMGITAQFDLRPGGAYRVEVIPGNVASGTFVEIDAPHRLVYTWGWEQPAASTVPPGSSTIEWELEATGDATIVRFRHSGLPTADAIESHGHGWDHYLGRFAQRAQGDDPGVDPWVEGPMS